MKYLLCLCVVLTFACKSNRTCKSDLKFYSLKNNSLPEQVSMDNLSLMENVPCKVYESIKKSKDSLHLGYSGNFRIINVYRITYDENVYLYIAKYTDTLDLNVFYVVVSYNLIEDSLSKNQITFDGTFAEHEEEGFVKILRLIEGTLLQCQDVNNDNHKEIVIYERHHNGTAINSLHEKIYILKDSNLKFELLQDIECKSYLPMDDVLIKRTLQNYTLVVTATHVYTGKIDTVGICQYDTELKRIISKKIIDTSYQSYLLSTEYAH